MENVDLETAYGDFKCPVCLQFADEPLESSCCHQIYCTTCAEGLNNKCTMCRQSAQFAASVIAKRVISKVPANCSHCDKKCTRGTIKDHEAECILLKCPAVGCKFQGIRAVFLCHLIENHHDELMKNVDRLFSPSKCEQIFNLLSVRINAAGRTARFYSTSNNPGGKSYCQGKLEPLCDCCDGFCGPINGCNCKDCMKLDIDRVQLPKGYLINRDGAVAKRASNWGFYCRRIIEATAEQDVYCQENSKAKCLACKVLDLQQFDTYVTLM